MQDRKQLELDSLLEVSKAINANMPEGALYKILYFTCISNLKVKKIAVYVHEGDVWECKVSHGGNADYKDVVLPRKLLSINEINFIDSFANLEGFEEFDVVVPVTHKKRVLSYVFVSGVEKFVVEGNPALSFIQTISNIVMVAIENKRLAREKLAQEAFKKELEIARNVQSHLFPRRLPDNGKVSIQSTYLPHRSVGGDYYDYVKMDDDHFLLSIADVSGKGIPAALLMSNFQASLRTLVRQTENLEEIVDELNYQLLSNANGESFITFFGCIVNTSTREMKYVNAGHNPPFLIQKGKPKLLKDGSTILGAFDKLPFINVGSETLEEGCLLVMYTDGLSETVNSSDVEFGEDRLEELIMKCSEKPLFELHDFVLEELDKFRGEIDYPDDLTLLSCRIY